MLKEQQMRGNGRRVSIYVNEHALRAWLHASKPLARPLPRRPATAASEDGEARPSAKDKET